MSDTSFEDRLRAAARRSAGGGQSKGREFRLGYESGIEEGVRQALAVVQAEGGPSGRETA